MPKPIERTLSRNLASWLVRTTSVLGPARRHSEDVPGRAAICAAVSASRRSISRALHSVFSALPLCSQSAMNDSIGSGSGEPPVLSRKPLSSAMSWPLSIAASEFSPRQHG